MLPGGGEEHGTLSLDWHGNGVRRCDGSRGDEVVIIDCSCGGEKV